jgi:thymidine phosphorylase
MRQMQKIIDAQGPSGYRAELGNLTFEVMAASDGLVSGIDCLQLNRLARTAGAPIDKGAGIRLFKKIGDRVESGEPLYRVYSFDQSEHDLAAASAKIDSGYAIERPTSLSGRATP